jgi:hypothetical protein
MQVHRLVDLLQDTHHITFTTVSKLCVLNPYAAPFRHCQRILKLSSSQIPRAVFVNMLIVLSVIERRRFEHLIFDFQQVIFDKPAEGRLLPISVVLLPLRRKPYLLQA